MVVGFAAVFLHLAAAAVWIGGVFFVTFAVLPAARDGRLDYNQTAMFVDRFSKVSLASALVLFVTGGHMAGTRYSVEALTTTVDGYLVVGMVLLWTALIGLLQIGQTKFRKAAERGMVMQPAGAATVWYRTAAVVSMLLLADAVMLTYPQESTGLTAAIGL